MVKFKIVHLDDHEILAKGIKESVIKSRPDVEFDYTDFRDADSAFKYISTGIKKDEAPDLIITDFIHRGMNGYEFAKKIRDFEKKNKRQPIPILLLTMVEASRPIIKKGLKEKVFNTYISLAERNLVSLIVHVIESNFQVKQVHFKI